MLVQSKRSAKHSLSVVEHYQFAICFLEIIHGILFDVDVDTWHTIKL